MELNAEHGYIPYLLSSVHRKTQLDAAENILFMSFTKADMSLRNASFSDCLIRDHCPSRMCEFIRDELCHAWHTFCVDRLEESTEEGSETTKLVNVQSDSIISLMRAC